MGPMPHPYATHVTPDIPPPPLGPSEAEAATLTSLATSQTCHPTNVLEVLVRALEVCRQDWVHGFVFNTQMSPLSVLTAPVNLSAALTCSISATYIAVDDPSAPPSPMAHLLDMQQVGNYIFVPAFSVGTITVGFGVQQFTKSCRAEWGYHVSNDSPASRLNSVDHFRYVRDDAKSVLLSVQMDERDDVIKLHFFEMLTATSRFRAVFTLRMSLFLKALRAQLVPDLVLCANPYVLQCLATTESRPCPQCGAQGGIAAPHGGSENGSAAESGGGSGSEDGGPGPRTNFGGAPTGSTKCTCEVIKHVPKHSYDFCYTYLSMRSYTGTFWGLAKAHYWANGKQVLAGNVASRIVIQGGEDQTLIQRLSRWAIMENIKDLKEDPLKGLLPTQASPTMHSADSINPNYPDTSPMLPRQSFGGGVDNDVVMDISKDHEFRSGAPRARHIAGSMISENEDRWPKQQVQPQPQQQDPGSPCFDDIEPVDTVGDEELTTYEIDPRPEAQQVQQPRQLQLPVQRSETPETQAQVSYLQLQQARPPTTQLSPVQSVQNQPMQAQAQQSHLPQTQPPKPQTQQRTLEKPQIEKPIPQINRNLQRDKRVELRKQRNREAAQRSNLRRKIKNDTLKRELSESNARAIELRAKELFLREENLRLRRKVKMFSTFSNKKA